MDEGLAQSLDRPSGLGDYAFVNARSAGVQTNGFDCGVFSLINIEKVISRPYDRPRDETPTNQYLMGLYRARIISKLYDQFYDNRQAALLL